LGRVQPGREGRVLDGSGGVEPPGPIHVAFAAKDRAEVRAFYAAAIAAGGRDNGAPGLRPQYDSDYYGAFVLDPDGHNIEAVCHAPETAGG
jgi:catechol 2,3-dioxygenase-like lactoylglutathione lyase family enzyme